MMRVLKIVLVPGQGRSQVSNQSFLRMFAALLALVSGMMIASNTTVAQTGGASAVASDAGPGFRSEYAEIQPGVRIHYVRGGAGKPVLLIPGWPQTWYAWRHLMPKLAAAGYEVIVADTRGMGQSSRPASGYDIGTVGTDLHRLMAERLGHDRYTVIGHDIGMWVGYAMAADRPQTIERLGLVDAVIPGIAQSPPMFMPQSENRLLWHFMFNQLSDLPETLISGREEAYLGWLFDNYAYRPGAVARDEYMRAYAPPGAMRAGLSYYRAIPLTIEQNKERAKQRLTMPVLALGGEFGTGDLPRASMASVTTSLQGGILPQCGHYVPEECPDQLAERLLPFLEGK
jgi:pimeloyl-ACP methyl ester carboxylesterase